jgi:hypothetical protein
MLKRNPRFMWWFSVCVTLRNWQFNGFILSIRSICPVGIRAGSLEDDHNDHGSSQNVNGSHVPLAAMVMHLHVVGWSVHTYSVKLLWQSLNLITTLLWLECSYKAQINIICGQCSVTEINLNIFSAIYMNILCELFSVQNCKLDSVQAPSTG